MKLRQGIWLGLLLMPVASIFGAQLTAEKKEDVSILIAANQLQKKLGQESLRVLDIRSKEDFGRGHVPGAIRVDVAEWKSLAASPNGFRDAKAWSEKVSALGLTKDSHVVLYGDKLSNTARVWWLLKYVGVRNASMLDGGWDYWKKTAKATETSTNTVSATAFKPDFQKDRLEEIDSLKQSLDSVTVIDTRSSEEFAEGRIRNSAHLEWKELLADDGLFKTKTELQRLFKKKRIVPTDTAVCY